MTIALALNLASTSSRPVATVAQDSVPTLMNTFRRDLVAASRIACDVDLSWLI